MNHWSELQQGLFHFSWLLNYLVPFIVSIVAASLNTITKTNKIIIYEPVVTKDSITTEETYENPKNKDENQLLTIESELT